MLHEAEHLPKHTINHIPISLNAKAAMGFMRERSRANELTLRHYFVDMMRKAIVVVFVAALTMSISAQGLIAGSVTSAVAFPKPDRPVADIVSPIWHDEKERDDAGEPRQLVRLLGIKSGMTIADIGAGSGYYVVRLSPIVGPRGRIIAQDVVPEYFCRACAGGCAISDCRTLQSASVSRTIRGCQLFRSILRSWCTCITRSPSRTACFTILSLRSSLVRTSALSTLTRRRSEHGTPPSLLRCELVAVGYREISLNRLTGVAGRRRTVPCVGPLLPAASG